MSFRRVLYLLMIWCSGLIAQQSHVGLYVNPDIDTANVEIAQVIQLWDNYLNTNPDSTFDNPYWITSEKQRYKRFDFLNSVYFQPSLYYFLDYYKPTVMSVEQIDSGYAIRTLFASQTDSHFSRPFCIIRILAVRENGKFRLSNILTFSTKSWQRETVGSITFIFPPSHRFNRGLAQRMNSFVDSLTAIWNLKPFPTEFYLADDLGDIMRMLGFDFYVGESYNRGTGGLSNIANRIVFGAGQDEWYPHEFVHLYINPLFPKAHYYFLEGYAALLGGSRGHELSWHMKRMQKYLEGHPDLNLDSLLMFSYFDSYTDPKYVFGGLLCRLALENGGLATLKRLLSFGMEDKDFYNAVQTVLGIKQQNLNQVIRKELAEYAQDALR
jgi:hypothetical protein